MFLRMADENCRLGASNFCMSCISTSAARIRQPDHRSTGNQVKLDFGLLLPYRLPYRFQMIATRDIILALTLIDRDAVWAISTS